MYCIHDLIVLSLSVLINSTSATAPCPSPSPTFSPDDVGVLELLQRPEIQDGPMGVLLTPSNQLADQTWEDGLRLSAEMIGPDFPNGN